MATGFHVQDVVKCVIRTWHSWNRKLLVWSRAFSKHKVSPEPQQTYQIWLDLSTYHHSHLENSYQPMVHTSGEIVSIDNIRIFFCWHISPCLDLITIKGKRCGAWPWTGWGRGLSLKGEMVYQLCYAGAFTSTLGCE